MPFIHLSSFIGYPPDKNQHTHQNSEYNHYSAFPVYYKLYDDFGILTSHNATCHTINV
ncbi:MAG: hypothetical protein LBF88_09475 [Planctomycetaceae bacterium]|nr:hypothetical protein [Planctomycetaceae bacterium]